ncbi:MAG: hypothetical protein IPP97_12005 [Candidatus Obscuribacter sp.]|jgi:hypothetical protein|nr:hypothetical protein [Candidatus Obscuribacter sp.]MBK9204120.1 hypothetical protein [Candidatus Obscuribacter sp.]MBL0186451.1 hypothetical protein [Candidatus Obscuribacter sp.]
MSTETNKPAAEVTTNTITVLVGVPGNLKSVTLDAGNATVKEALLRAELSAEGRDIRVAGQPANGDTPLTNGQTILMFKAIAGNNVETENPQVVINVGIPGKLKQVEFDAGSTVTVADVLSKAEIKADGQDIRVAGQPANMGSVVTNGQTVLLFRPIAGN